MKEQLIEVDFEMIDIDSFESSHFKGLIGEPVSVEFTEIDGKNKEFNGVLIPDTRVAINLKKTRTTKYLKRILEKIFG